MLNSVTNQVPGDKLAKAVFYLIKEVGLTHKEIFGEDKLVNRVDEVERDGVLGDYLDYVFGEKKVEKTEKVKTPAMHIRTFQTYLDLYEEHQEEKEKQQKKQKMRQKLKQGNTI